MAKAAHQLTNTTDYQLKQAFKSLFGLPPAMLSEWVPMEDVLGWIDDFSESALPFSIRTIRIVTARFAVIGEVLTPMTRSKLADFMEETPDSIVLFTDALLRGASSVYFAKYLSEDRLEAVDQIASWYKAMTSPRVIVGRCADKPLILASAGSFKANGRSEE